MANNVFPLPRYRVTPETGVPWADNVAYVLGAYSSYNWTDRLIKAEDKDRVPALYTRATVEAMQSSATAYRFTTVVREPAIPFGTQHSRLALPRAVACLNWFWTNSDGVVGTTPLLETVLTANADYLDAKNIIVVKGKDGNYFSSHIPAETAQSYAGYQVAYTNPDWWRAGDVLVIVDAEPSNISYGVPEQEATALENTQWNSIYANFKTRKTICYIGTGGGTEDQDQIDASVAAMSNVVDAEIRVNLNGYEVVPFTAAELLADMQDFFGT